MVRDEGHVGDHEWTEIARGLQFPEGPVAMPDGSVLLVEIQRGTVDRVTPDGSVQVLAETGGGPNGLAIGPDGAAYVCNNGGCFSWRQVQGLTLPGPRPDSWKGGSIQRVDLATGSVTTLYTEADGVALRAPNDLVFDSGGGMWFTDHGTRTRRTSDRTGVFYAAADGSSIREVLHPLDAPNGIALSPGEDRLYVAETPTGRVWAWDITSPGQCSGGNPLGPAGGTLLAGLPGMQRLDSMAVDSAGNVCVATLVNGGITVIAPGGASVEHVPTDDLLTTNICFGGNDLRTAYVTLSGTGRLVSTTWPRPGLPLAFGTRPVGLKRATPVTARRTARPLGDR